MVEEESLKVAQMKSRIFRVQKAMVFPDKLLAQDTEVDPSSRHRRQA